MQRILNHDEIDTKTHKAIVRGGWAKIKLLPFEALVAVLAMAAGLTFWMNPDQPLRGIDKIFHPWDYAWATMYGLGGILMVVGLWKNRRNIEAMGLIFLAGGVVVQAIAIASSLETAQALVSMIYYGATVLACWVRFSLIKKKEYVVIVNLPEVEVVNGD